MSSSVLPMFSSKSFIVSGLTFRPLIHFIFVYSVRKCSSIILLDVAVKFSQHHLLKRLSLPHCIFLPPASLVAQMVKLLPAIWETWVQSLVWEDPLEKEMATHSSLLAWKIPWTEKPGRLPPKGSQRLGHDFTFTLSKIKYP